MNTTVTTRKFLTVGNMTRIAMLTALACLLDLIPGIPIVGFYKLDFSLLPVMLGNFSMGPIAGAIILALKCLIGWAHSTTMGIGKLADFIMGLALIIPAGLIYARNKTRNQMMPMEKILAMCGADSEWKLLLIATAPFNLLKGVVLSLITGIIYKPLSPLLHGKIR